MLGPITDRMRRRKAGWLRARGFDGLWSDGCGCRVGDLAPCEERECFDVCEPAYVSDCRCGTPPEHDFHVGPDKPPFRAGQYVRFVPPNSFAAKEFPGEYRVMACFLDQDSDTGWLVDLGAGMGTWNSDWFALAEKAKPKRRKRV